MTVDKHVREERIALIRKQEKLAVFSRFNEEDAFDLGSMVILLARQTSAPVIVNIRTPNRTLFHASLPGSAADNDEWARRKSNIVLRYNQSSLLFGETLALKGREINPDMGITLAEYAGHGGSFPIRIVQGLVIAAITVSGLRQIDDHNMVVEALGSYLKLELPKVPA
jgi:uncharacterized protein (UPF0303 family)